MKKFSRTVKADCDGIIRNIRRQGTPRRVYFMELFLDMEVQDAVVERFDLTRELDINDPHYALKRQIAIQSYLGYDYVVATLKTAGFPPGFYGEIQDTAPEKQRREKRSWLNEHQGPIQTWEDFEKYHWPDPSRTDTSELEWCSRNLPEDMCMTVYCNFVFEQVTSLMGYEHLCYSLYDNPKLVDAMFEKSGRLQYEIIRHAMDFDRVRIIFGSDDMGFKTGTMIPPHILIDKSISWHAKTARLAHEHGKVYLLHSCGNLTDVMESIISGGIDGKHSFEDAIQPVTEFKRVYGDYISAIGGIDVDFLCRSDEKAIRKRVREVLDICMPGGGYCLGTGNSVANYVPIDSYLVMLDEGRRYGS